jgi:hypothetical protein
MEPTIIFYDPHGMCASFFETIDEIHIYFEKQEVTQQIDDCYVIYNTVYHLLEKNWWWDDDPQTMHQLLKWISILPDSMAKEYVTWLLNAELN